MIILGAGGHARVLLNILRMLNHPILGLLDDSHSKWGGNFDGVEVLGPLDETLNHSTDQIRLVNAIGSVAQPEKRRAIFERFRDFGYYFTTLVHPQAIIAPEAQLGMGTQVMAGAVIQTGVKIEDNVIVNTQASLDHDCRIGAHCHIAPGTTLCGDVHVGEMSHIGAGAVIIQGIMLGANSMVAAGATVIRDVPEGRTVCGLPARPM